VADLMSLVADTDPTTTKAIPTINSRYFIGFCYGVANVGLLGP
jgi:hypothetical protein